MAFCRNCGNALADGQAFCTKCGTRIAEATPPAQAAAPSPPQPASTPPAPAPRAAAPPPSYAPPAATAPKGSSFAKILLVLVVVVAVFGAIGLAAVLYVGHRIHQKAEELGLTPDAARRHVSTLGGVNACSLLSKDDVGKAVGMDIVRAEPDRGDRLSCAFYVQGDAGALTMKHAERLSQDIAKNTGSAQPQMTQAQQDQIENMGKTMFHSMATSPESGLADHPGECPVFTFVVDDNAAQFQMKVDRVAFTRIGPFGAADIPNLGDEAFDAAGAMMLVRKGDKIVRVTYMQCPCGKDDVVPLVQKVLAGLP